MKKILFHFLLALGLLAVPWSAGAVVNCSLGSPGFTGVGYNPTTPGGISGQSTVTVSCTRSDPVNDPTTVSYAISINNGLYNNRALLSGGATYINYDLYVDTCMTFWKNKTITGTVNFGVSASDTQYFWGCIPSGQTTLPAGTYLDTPTMTLNYGKGPQQRTTQNTFPVSIITPSQCSVLSGTAPIDLGTYTAFQAASVTGSTTIVVSCTKYTAYSMALDAGAGVIAGLNYTLSPSTWSNLSGSGSQQSYAVTATMPGNQAGTCATGTCSGSQTHVVTLTY